MIGTDGMDDVTILVNSSPEKLMGLNLSFSNGYPSVSTAVMCAKASMLLQNVPPSLLLRFLRDHRSEWPDNNVDAYSASAIKLGPCSLPGSRAGNFGGQVILPLAHTIEHEELLEVIKLEGLRNCPEDALMARDMFLLQLCSGMDENAVGMCLDLYLLLSMHHSSRMRLFYLPVFVSFRLNPEKKHQARTVPWILLLLLKFGDLVIMCLVVMSAAVLQNQ